MSILNRSDRIAFSLSPFFCVVVAFCFSMTIGVLWEFFEFGMDEMFGLDMQKDTVVTGISSTLLDPSGLAASATYRPYRIRRGQRAGARCRRIFGHRAARYHGRPVRELRRSACVLGHRVPLPQKQERGSVRATFRAHPPHRPTMSKL